ncbi:hypothetical protein ACLB1N_05810 [Escherichia coli]
MRCCKRYGNKVFDTTAIEQQEQEISRSLRQQGELAGGPCTDASNNSNSVSR